MSRERSVRREGAVTSRADRASRAQAWLSHHRESAADSLARLLARPLGSLLTCLAIGIVLALPAVFALTLQELGQLAGKWQAPARISLFLDASVDEALAADLHEELAANPDLSEVAFLSREAALEEFRTLSGFASVLDSLDHNPLPHVLLVAPREGVDAAQLREDFAADSRVDEAVLDSAWLARLQQLTALGQRVVWLLGGLLVFGVVLILGNTLRLAIENRREEILVVKLVGGSDAFVRRPFLYTGLWYGVGGGACAALLVVAVFALLAPAVGELIGLYGGQLAPGNPGLMAGLDLILLGGVLGLAGAWLAVARHLGAIEPR